MDGAGSAPEVRDLSRAPGFAQRVITAGFALNVLGDQYNPKRSNRHDVAKPVFAAIGTDWERGESDTKKVADAARYFEDWYLLKKPAAARTLGQLRNYMPGLEYLDGLERLQSLDTKSISDLSYIPLAGASLVVLESTRAERKKLAVDLRSDLAEAILGAIAKRWRPGADGYIQLPGLPIGGLANVGERRHPSAEKVQPLLAEFRFQASGDAIRLYPTHRDISCVDYLLSLATDANPLPMEAILRWSIDLTSALLAVRCLQCAAVEPYGKQASKGRHISNLAYDGASIEGLAARLLGPLQQKWSDQVLCSTVERISALIKSERVLRGMWGDWTIRFAHRSLGWLWPMLGTEPVYFLRAFERHPLPTLPIVETREGTEIKRQLQYLLKPEVLSLSRLSLEVQDNPVKGFPSVLAQSGADGESWIETFRRVSRGMAHSFGKIAERCNAEGRTPRRQEYADFLLKLELSKAELRSKSAPDPIQAIINGMRGKKPPNAS